MRSVNISRIVRLSSGIGLHLMERIPNRYHLERMTKLDDGCFREWKTKPEQVYRNGRIEYQNRLDWLPEEWRQVGIGYDDEGNQERVSFFMPDGSVQMISKDIVSFLTVPPERIFETDQEELYFCLFNRRTWYLRLKDGVFHARYSK